MFLSSLEMPVSICQYRGAVGVFYFRISGQIKPLFLVINTKNTCKLDMALTVKFSIFILLFFLIIKFLNKNRYRFKYKPLCHCFYILVLILYLYKIWLFGHLADLSNDIKKTLVQSLTKLKIYQFVTGISTVFARIITSKLIS